MARKPKRIETQATSAEILNRDPDNPMTEGFIDEPKGKQTSNEKLVEWITGRTDAWKQHRDANYAEDWNVYERLWRQLYSKSESTRKTERSQIISPALSEAVENGVAEIEEAVFGRGDFFDVRPEHTDDPLSAQALSRNEIQFKSDLAQSEFPSNNADALILSAVYGTGIGEIVPDVRKLFDAKFQVNPETQEKTMMVREIERTFWVLKPVSPRNFLIDPAACTIEEAMGVAIEEDVSVHLIREGIEAGDYNDVEIGSGSGDTRIKADPQVETPWHQDTVTVLRYYGKVPESLLFPAGETEKLYPEERNDDDEDPAKGRMVEAVVFIADGEHLLKAEETRDVMKDRPVVAFPWDSVPGRFWGRGVGEKGVTPQKLLDAELRSRIDALAYVSAPMMAMDASRLPRGFKLEIYPGKNVLLAGDPSEILKPFKFGELDQNSAQQVELMDRMVQRATGSIDAGAMAQQGVSGQARSGAVSMALSGVVKRNKRTLMRYVDRFLVKAMRKMLWRYMQYDQDFYVPINFSFNMGNTMGIMQREYETQSLTAVVQTLQPGSTEHMLLLMSVVANSGIQNRDAVLAELKSKYEKLKQAEQVPPVDPNAQQEQQDPMMQQLMQMRMQLEMEEIKARIIETRARAAKLAAETQTELIEPQLEAQKLAMRGIYNTPEDQMQGEFDRRMELADKVLKGRELDLRQAEMVSNERITEKQLEAATKKSGASAPRKAPETPPAPTGVRPGVTIMTPDGPMTQVLPMGPTEP